MIKVIRAKLASKILHDRIIWASLVAALLFFGVTLLSNALLPEGLLRNKNPLQAWEGSQDIIMLSMQLFLYNMISVIVIVAASIFASKTPDEKNYLSVGYLTLFVMVILNALVLGTWSFAMGSMTAPPLFERIVHMLNMTRSAGLWEMMGQLAITCAVAQSALIRTNGHTTEMRRLQSIQLSHQEKVVVLIGVGLMIIGAIVESGAILGR